MAHRRQGLSRTLPKNFTFPSMRAEELRTPEPASIPLDVPPPPPRPASCRLRRFRIRSGTDVFAQAESDLTSWNSDTSNDCNDNNTNSDIPLPSIEFPHSYDDAVDPLCGGKTTGPASNDRFLAPPQDRTALKTPPAQIRTTPIEMNTTGGWPAWERQASEEPIQRPGSACSHASDSSISSIETFASRRSVGGSCTSAESDLQDPFFFLEFPKKPVVETLPLPQNNGAKKMRREVSKDRWTVEMDSHLWNTYQSYIQDPTMTPFKMTPGSIPPLGVTHRVSREAKKTWDRKAFRLNRQFPFGVRQTQDGNTTPTPKTNSAAKKPGWPRSEASTRRRLKLLCRRKFSIAPHYQRLMLSKTPEPLVDSSSRESSCFDGPEQNSTAFATRDLGVSLVSSSVPEPLAQLTADEPPRQDNHVDWFNHPVHSGGNPPEPTRSGASVAKRSLGLDGPGMAPRLGSPFNYHTWGPDNSKRRIHRHSPMGRGRRETIHVTGHRLRSPPRMDLFSSMNNHTQGQDPFISNPMTSDPDTYSHLEEYARQGKLNDLGNRRVRIRNRGATTSAVNSRAVHQLFSPPSSSSKDETTPREKPFFNHRRNLSGDSIKRLGSPFKMEGPRRPQSSSGRSIRHAPSSSDPFSNGQLAKLEPLPHLQTQGALPYDPTEPGLSDAERIRRQILNMPYSRR